MLSTLKGSSTRAQFLRYSVVGMSGFIVDFGGYALLTRLVGLPMLVANTISFSCAVVNNYIWHKVWTFRHDPQTAQLEVEGDAGAAASVMRKQTGMGLDRQFGVFVLVSVIGLGMNSLILHTVASHPSVAAIFGKHADYVGKAIAVPIVWFWNFGANKFWTFRKG